MKKLFIILIAVLTASVYSFGQITPTELNYSEKDSVWSEGVLTLWEDYSAINPYAELITFDDIKGEDIIDVYHVVGITQSRGMITDSISGDEVVEYPEQWMISYKDNGTIVAFVTYDDPTESGVSTVTADYVAERMVVGLYQGDSKESNATSENDSKYAATEDQNLKLPESQNGF